ncbi:hypothetical protein [Kamptonema sp. UHCC 0994]|uniref:hypothetical protein n=1 Tax=Kamptonema sp. UHCC 0994 TaxID=3031329 RepID=UPI0023BAE71E|nr:hypothetical protein [Kamptonema sp. UHCC 0994]MDF0556575.1 hypothetical protein [Kamptonema sp. UHCC 0994]
MIKISFATMSAKKESPEYAALRGHIPRDLYKRFKIFCLERGIDNSQGLEELLTEYFQNFDAALSGGDVSATPITPMETKTPVS